MGEAQ